MSYLQLTCPYELVEDPRHLKRIIETRFKDIDVVGIDCEKKPNFSKGFSTDLALLQIATRKSVILIDVFSLGDHYPDLWRKLVSVLFNNRNIIKLGFDLKHDIQMINERFRYINVDSSRNFLDLYSLTEKITGRKYNLSALVHECLGRPLNKFQCMSNWEQRPLSEAQIEYAALDAHCLIQIYDALPTHFDLNPVYWEAITDLQFLGNLKYQPKSATPQYKENIEYTNVRPALINPNLEYTRSETNTTWDLFKDLFQLTFLILLGYIIYNIFLQK